MLPKKKKKQSSSHAKDTIQIHVRHGHDSTIEKTWHKANYLLMVEDLGP